MVFSRIELKTFPHRLGISASQRRGDGATLGATSDHHRRRDLRSPFPLAIPRSARPHPTDTVIHAGQPMIQPTRAPSRRTVPRPQARIPKATTAQVGVPRGFGAPKLASIEPGMYWTLGRPTHWHSEALHTVTGSGRRAAHSDPIHRCSRRRQNQPRKPVASLARVAPWATDACRA